MSATEGFLADNDSYAAARTDARLAPYGLPELDTGVRQSVKRLAAGPFVPHTDAARGSVLGVADGCLREVV